MIRNEECIIIITNELNQTQKPTSNKKPMYTAHALALANTMLRWDSGHPLDCHARYTINTTQTRPYRAHVQLTYELLLVRWLRKIDVSGLPHKPICMLSLGFAFSHFANCNSGALRNRNAYASWRYVADAAPTVDACVQYICTSTRREYRCCCSCMSHRHHSTIQ